MSPSKTFFNTKNNSKSLHIERMSVYIWFVQVVLSVAITLT